MSQSLTSFSTVPLLFAVQLSAIALATRHAIRAGHLARPAWIGVLMGVLVLWAVASTWLALSGVYESQAFLAAYPLVWLPFVPVVAVALILVLFRPARDAVRALIDGTPTTWLIGIHALRLLAIGTLIKAWSDAFARSFALWVGIPDLLFGLSALVMVWLAARGRVTPPGLLAWSLLGVLVILPGAPLVGQMGLPGLLHAIKETPSITTLFAFPMVLAPSLVVPIFVMMNLLVAIGVIERSVESAEASPV